MYYILIDIVKMNYKIFQRITLFVCAYFLAGSWGFTQTKDYSIKGYFTSFSAREHESDMPRDFYLLIAQDGTITSIAFDRYSSNNTGEFSPWQFNPRKYLGKTIQYDFTGEEFLNNREFPVLKNGVMSLLPLIRVDITKQITVLNDNFTVPDIYRYPVKDTLVIPHRVTVNEEFYYSGAADKTVNLKNYITSGAGTNASPYISSGGDAGFLAAFNNLPQGGTVLVESGVYRITAAFSIPRNISIKGIGGKKPYILLEKKNAIIIKGTNTLENLTFDFSSLPNSYVSYMFLIDNSARNVTIKNVKMIGNYTVSEGGFIAANPVCGIRLNSHIKDLTFDTDTFINVFRGIEFKGQRNLHRITLKNSHFEGFSFTPISLDQGSDMGEVLIENNTVRDFVHFGFAFARINGVILRNNNFYTRNKRSPETFNQGLHLEEHCQNFIVENNIVDIDMRIPSKQESNPAFRSAGISVSDGRFVTIRNNEVKNSHINFSGNTSKHCGKSIAIDNLLTNGSIQINDANMDVKVEKNRVVDPPESALSMYSVMPMSYPFSGHVIRDNIFESLQGIIPISIKAEVNNVTVSNNKFYGCSMQSNLLDFRGISDNLVISDNTFFGLTSQNAFSVLGTFPPSNTVAQYKSANSFNAECKLSTGFTLAEVESNRIHVFPNPVVNGKLKLKIRDFKGCDLRIIDAQGRIIYTTKMSDGNSEISFGDFPASGIYLVSVFDGNEFFNKKIIVLKK